MEQKQVLKMPFLGYFTYREAGPKPLSSVWQRSWGHGGQPVQCPGKGWRWPLTCTIGPTVPPLDPAKRTREPQALPGGLGQTLGRTLTQLSIPQAS